MENHMEKEFIDGLMEKSMMESLIMGSDNSMEYLKIIITINIKDNLRINKQLGYVKLILPMGIILRVIYLMGYLMEMENLHSFKKRKSGMVLG